MEFKINVDTYTDGGGKIQTFLTGGCGRHTHYSNSGYFRVMRAYLHLCMSPSNLFEGAIFF